MKLSTSALFTLCMILVTCSGHAQSFVNTYISNSLVKQNQFLSAKADLHTPASFSTAKSALPEPIWPTRQDVLKCYWKTWELAFSNVRGATKFNGFISPYIDPAFNGHIFMWDTSFMVMFGRYGHRAFNFQGSLDNFYHRQHPDGFICREISTVNGDEIFQRFDPSSTGPNIMPWAEWEYFKNFNDKNRLSKVFTPLLAYYQWFRTNRSWPDGTYFSTGWGCGMDNQPRVPDGFSLEFSPAFMSWIDTSLQAVFAAKVLIAMAKQLNREAEVKDIQEEVTALTNFLQKYLWDTQTAFYYDRFRDGSKSKVKSIAAYWALLADVVPKDQLDKFVAHLENPKEFARLHRVPTLSADDPGFKADGHYWQGGVWAPTSYMVLRGLTNVKKDSLAYEIAFNHLDNVVKVYNETGTLFENYAPDSLKGMYRKDMVGWTGLVPIAVLFEYVFGIRPNVPDHLITWDIRLTDEFGLKKYPFKRDGLVDFWCAARKKPTDRPRVKVKSNVALDLKLIWAGGTEMVHIKPGK